MPSLKSRIFPYAPESQRVSSTNHPRYVAPDGDSQLSPPGNIAPIRSTLPPEFTYDFQTNRFNPDTPYFMRGAVDIITPVRNLALQAAAAAGIKLT